MKINLYGAAIGAIIGLAVGVVIVSLTSSPAESAERHIRLNPAMMNCYDLALAVGVSYDATVKDTGSSYFEEALDQGDVVTNLAWFLSNGSENQKKNASASLRFFEIFMNRGC